MRNVFLAMTKKRFGFFEYGKGLFLFLLISTCFASSILAGESGGACPTKEEIIRKTGALQMPFIANNGQVDEQVKFYAKTFGGTVFVTKDGEIVYSLPKSEKAENGRHKEPTQISLNGSIGSIGLNRLSCFEECSSINTFYSYLNSVSPSNANSRSIALKETIVGAKIGGIAGEQPSVTKVSYFKGNDKSKWQTNIPTFNTVNLGEVCEGIGLSLKAYGDNVEKLFCVKPGASPAFIKVQIDGGTSLRVNQEGQLEADTELGPVKFTRPIAYQEIEGKRVEVAAEYSIHGAWEQGGRGEFETQNSKPETGNSKLTYGFIVASYDKTKDLIIDPLLASTYLGGTRGEEGSSLAIDASGNVYVTGCTSSSNFPTTIGVYDASYNGGESDVFISKLNSGLTSLLASTYLGGTGWDDGCSLSLNYSAPYEVYVTGFTASKNFPTTIGAYDTSYNGGGFYVGDIFVSKLNDTLTSLEASTFLGGSGSDMGNSINFNSSGSGTVYVTGYTTSKNFPTTSGAFDTTSNGGGSDAFVSKLNSGLTSLEASTFLGGSKGEEATSIRTRGGDVYLTGYTSSSNFPTTVGAYDTTYNSGKDAFVSKLNSGLTSLSASTFLGGSKDDCASGLDSETIGADIYIYLTGYTSSSNFPTTIGAYDTTYNGGYDVFVSKLDSGLTSLAASTFLGGKANDCATSLNTTGLADVFVTGYTASKDFPTTAGASDTSYNGGKFDAFVSKLNSGLTGLTASTFLGGSGDDYGNSIDETTGSVYVTGYTYSKNFPTTIGALDTSYNGSCDAFVTRMDNSAL